MRETSDSLDARLGRVRARIQMACEASGREPSSVTLVAVGKRHPAEALREAYAAGQRDFGENYVQELLSKAEALSDLSDVRWHFIGHLQRNKVKHLIPVGPSVETVDSQRLGEEVARRSHSMGRTTPVLLQVNIGEEPQKSGCPIDEAKRLVEGLLGQEGIELRGLMAVPPVTDSPDGARPYFRRLRELARELGLTELSMGMSHDLEVAVEEGATLVRVGTAIFGPRPV